MVRGSWSPRLVSGRGSCVLELLRRGRGEWVASPGSRWGEFAMSLIACGGGVGVLAMEWGW